MRGKLHSSLLPAKVRVLPSAFQSGAKRIRNKFIVKTSEEKFNNIFIGAGTGACPYDLFFYLSKKYLEGAYGRDVVSRASARVRLEEGFWFLGIKMGGLSVYLESTQLR